MVNKLKLAKKLRNKKDKEWRLAVLQAYGNECFICSSKKLLNCHHIIPREFKETRHDVKNGIVLCPLHHKWGMFSAHKNPIWFIQRIPKGDLKYLFERVNGLYLTTEYKK